MSENPYSYEGDDDAELLGRPGGAASHAYDGSVCQACGIVHQVYVENGTVEDLPPGFLEGLDGVLNSIPPTSDISRSDIYVHRMGGSGTTNTVSGMAPAEFVDALETFLDRLARIDDYSSPRTQALAEVLDEVSQGRYLALVAKRKAEYRLTVEHTVSKALTSIANISCSTGALAPLMQALAVLELRIAKRLSRAQQEYLDLAATQGFAPDEVLVGRGGVANDVPPAFRSYLSEPISVDHLTELLELVEADITAIAREKNA